MGSKHSKSKHQIHQLDMSRKFKVLVVVATLATVGHLQPLDTQGRDDRHFFGRFARDVSDDDLVNQITGLLEEYIDAYWQAKKEWRMGRTNLTELALRTRYAVRDIKILIKSWDDKETAFIEKEFQM